MTNDREKSIKAINKKRIIKREESSSFQLSFQCYTDWWNWDASIVHTYSSKCLWISLKDFLL